LKQPVQLSRLLFWTKANYTGLLYQTRNSLLLVAKTRIANSVFVLPGLLEKRFLLQSLNFIPVVLQSITNYSSRNCWKNSYNPAVVASHVDRPEYWLFRPALLKGFSPDCRIVTLVNTSTVTIILCYCIILVIGYKPGLASI
jgi:hypothetical protein